MTDQLPERIWVGNFYFGQVSYREPPDQSLPSKEYISADTAVPRAEADAMVAAAVKQARYIAHIAWGWPESEASSMPVCEAISEITPADARAAFEQAVREAVEAERERCARIAAAFTPDDEWDRGGLIAAAIRAPQETSE